jgi:hypothetical protein
VKGKLLRRIHGIFTAGLEATKIIFIFLSKFLSMEK